MIRRLIPFRVAASLMVAMAVAACTLAGPPAGAANEPDSGRCRGGSSGPTCKFQYGHVQEYGGTDDGDGIKITLDGDDTPRKVRLTGINAMELHKYGQDERGECHGVEATRRLRELIDELNDNPGRVRLAAQRLSSVAGVRLRRSVAVQINGTWRDVGTILVSEGHVLPHANGIEVAWNNTYRRLAQQAAAAGRNLYDRDYCGAGPHQTDVDRSVKLYANWDAEGHDGSNLNGEWVRLRNASGTAISIGGWWLRDSHTRNAGAHGYTFPSWAKIPAHGAVTLHVGRGTNTATRFYIGESNSIFDNVSRDARGMGDGAYLFDPDGDLRKWQIYACLSGCNDPLKGRINVKADPTREESIAVRNTSTRNVDLDGHLIVNFPYSYSFTRRTILKPGETLRLWVTKRGNDTRLVRHWRKSNNALNDGGDVVSVRTFDNQMSDCHSWGSGNC